MAEAPADPLADLKDAALLDDLTDDQRRQLRVRHVLKVGDDLVWIDPERRVRRQRASTVYYAATARGVWRVSKLTGDIVEV